MWIAVLLVLLITGTIFYGLARNHKNLQDYKKFQNAISGKKQIDDDSTYLPTIKIYSVTVSTFLVFVLLWLMYFT